MTVWEETEALFERMDKGYRLCKNFGEVQIKTPQALEPRTAELSVIPPSSGASREEIGDGHSPFEPEFGDYNDFL
jgi:hypothetical protein